ncbi:MAG: family protein phosphatase [Actinomycetota bacterium]|nr:family protein phosphatase [Actinomycetota bacterium]
MAAVRWGCATDTGRVRHCNEDALLAGLPVFVVADGMGGHAGGELASHLVVDSFHELTAHPVPVDVQSVLARAHTTLRAASERDERVRGLGATAVGLVLVEQAGAQYWLAFNVGDSRLYRFHRRRLHQITVDHSFVQEMVEAGFLDAQQARQHPERHVITRVLGGRDSTEPDFWLFPPEAGEKFLLCTDGLTDEIDDDRIGRILREESDPQAAAGALVRAALEAGGRDNVTAVVVSVGDPEDSVLDLSDPRSGAVRWDPDTGALPQIGPGPTPWYGDGAPLAPDPLRDPDGADGRQGSTDGGRQAVRGGGRRRDGGRERECLEQRERSGTGPGTGGSPPGEQPSFWSGTAAPNADCSGPGRWFAPGARPNNSWTP